MTLALEGPLAPPMANGELAFEEPWQGRVFGMANALCKAGIFEWREFQASLIAAIEPHGVLDDDEYAYYDHFQVALETLLISKGLTSEKALATRQQAIADRPHGHDH